MQRLQCCSQYQFAVVDATVVVRLQSILWLVTLHAAVAHVVKPVCSIVNATVAVLQSTPVCSS